MSSVSPAESENDAIAALEARMARIESVVLRMGEVIEQLPALTAMAGDVADEEVARLAARGVDVDARIRQALHLTEQITRPEALTAFERLTEQAVRAEDTVGMMLDIADDFAERVGRETGHSVNDRVGPLLDMALRVSEPGTLANLQRLLDLASVAEGNLGMVLDIADDFVSGLATEDQDAEARLRELMRLFDRLSAPETVRLAHKLLDRSGNLEQLMDVALAAPDTLGMVMDAMDEALLAAEAQGIDLGTIMPSLTQALLRAVHVAGSDELQQLIDSYVLDPAALDVVSQAANALVQTRNQPPGKAGLFKALGAMSDPEIQTALDFAIRFGRRFGAAVQNPRQLPDNS